MRNDIACDDLMIGLTRPVMYMGVPAKLFFGNLMLCTLFCLNIHTLYGIPLFFLIHGVFTYFSSKDQNFAHLWFKFLKETPPVLNFYFWQKMNSYKI